MQDDLKKLHGKIIQAAKRKDETLRRQFQNARSQAFPGGEPQERADLLLAFYNGFMVNLDARMLGATFYIPTVIVPPLLITHGLIFWLLVRRKQ